MVFIRYPFEKRTAYFHSTHETVDSSRIRNHVISRLGTDDFSLYYNGKELFDVHDLSQNATVHVTFSLPGGKGGFGSMLRAIGAQIEKTTNREACRDLSGRRLRDINEEQRLKKWIAKEAEREAEKIQRRKARIERLKTKPKHDFVDFEYEKEISLLPERIEDALTAGMQKMSKRPSEEEASSKACPKKKCVWLNEDLSSESDSESCAKSLLSGDAGGSSRGAGVSSGDAGGSSRDAGVSSGDAGCSSSSDGNKNDFLPSLCSEASGSEASNSCSGFEAKTPVNLEVQTSEQQESHDVHSHEELSSNSTKPVDMLSDVPTEQASSIINEKTSNADNSDSVGLLSVTNAADSAVKQEVIETLKEKSSSAEKVQDDDSPVDLLAFNSAEELEILGLDRLKSALMTRGLKCGGNISDRAQRLWKVRGLQPEEYPANLLAKKKK